MIEVNRTSIETGLWAIERNLMEKHGVSAAQRMISPLHYYINTGRASTDFLRKLLSAKPFMIARILAKGGSDLEILNRIKGYLKIETTF